MADDLPTVFSKFCPRCDREYQSTSPTVAQTSVDDHVKRAHPEYDPEWDKE